MRWLLIAVPILCALKTWGEESMSPPNATAKLKGITIHGGEQQFLEVEGKVCLTDGILEFIAVEPGGRDYESIFTLNCKPSALQFAMLLIGCEAGALPRNVEAGKKIGTRLGLEAEWQVDGKPRRVAVHELLIDRKTKKPPPPLVWIFTGSYFTKDLQGRDLFIADAEEAFISLWWNPAIPINLAGDYGNPYRGDEQGFEVNTAAIPPQGTPIKFILRKAKN